MSQHDDADRLARALLSLVTRASLCFTRPRQDDLNEVEYHTLLILQAHTGMPLSAGEVARLINIPPQQLSRAIKALTDPNNPRISCIISPTDRRAVELRITKQGEMAIIVKQRTATKLITDRFARLSELDKDRLTESFTVINDVLKAHI